MAGDIDGDGTVGVTDVYAVAKAYGSQEPPLPSPPDHPWNPNCDIDDDGNVMITDYYYVQRHYGEEDP